MSRNATVYYKGIAAIASFHHDAIDALKVRFSEEELSKCNYTYQAEEFKPDWMAFGFTYSGDFVDYEANEPYPVEIAEVIHCPLRY